MYFVYIQLVIVSFKFEVDLGLYIVWGLGLPDGDRKKASDLPVQFSFMLFS